MAAGAPCAFHVAAGLTPRGGRTTLPCGHRPQRRPAAPGRCRVIPWLGANDPFPPVTRALREPNGLLAAGRTLSVPTLLEAYTLGLFPWFNEDEPVLWWSP